MGYFDKVKKFIQSRGNKKNINDLIIILIIGLIIVIVANFFISPENVSPGYVEVNSNNNEEKAGVNTAMPAGGYEENLKQELTNTLTQIDGAGRVKVMIYFETGSESVPAFNQTDSTKVTEENDGSGGKRLTNEKNSTVTVVDVNEGGGSKPFILKEVKPKITGIIVIAEGADDPNVKYKLYEAVKTVFSIEQYKVNIYPMEKNK